MEYFDHALLGATLGLASGTQRRYGWAVVAMSAAAGALPDWDAVPYPSGTPYYSSVHRVWGHNLLAATLLSGLVGAVGYLCWQSVERPWEDPSRKEDFSPRGLAVWVMVGVLASLGHLLADVFYCGKTGRSADWPVLLFWPFSRQPVALPLVPWADRGVTWILGVALISACVRPSASRLLGVLGLLVVVGYVALRGLVLLGP